MAAVSWGHVAECFRPEWGVAPGCFPPGPQKGQVVRSSRVRTHSAQSGFGSLTLGPGQPDLAVLLQEAGPSLIP